MAEYILRPPTADGGDGYILKAPEKPAAVSAGEMLMQVPRQVGLAARYGAEGLADVAQIGTEPIRYFLNPALRAVGLPAADGLRNTVSGYLDKAGLPKPEGANERVIGDATRLVAGAGGLAGAASKGAQVISGGAAPVLEALASNPGAQAVSAASAGAAGGATREAGGGPLAQFGAALVGGLGGAGVAALGQKVYNSLADAVKNYLTPKSSVADINVTLNGILEQNGIDVSKVASSVRAQLLDAVQQAQKTGGNLNPEVIRRIADYGAVGATPTRGTVTLDPAILTREKNLAKMGANSSDPNLQQLAQLQNSNNATLIRNLNEMGAATENASASVAGQKLIGAIESQQAAQQANVRRLYDGAKDSSGRAIQFVARDFVGDAYNRLAQSNRGAFLPEGIKNVLEQLRAGRQTLPDGTTAPMPFTVDTIDNVKTMLSSASRGTQDGNVKAALSQVREALDNVRPVAVGRQPMGGTLPVDPNKLATAQSQADALSQESLNAFDAARKAARDNFKWQESAQGIKAALENPNPDRFVQDFIISRGNKSQTAEVESLIYGIKSDPVAMTAVKENILGYLKNKALGGASDEVGNFSASGFNRALNEIGDMKLRLFFSPEQIAQIKTLGRVASYETVQPRGSAVNNSNTATTLGGWFADALSKIANSNLVGKIPMGDVAIRNPARNWSAQLEVKAAMDPYAAASIRSPVPQSGRLADLLGPGLLLSAPKANGRDDKRGN